MEYAYFALTKLHWPVSRFANLPPREKAMTIAMISRYLAARKKQADELKRRRR